MYTVDYSIKFLNQNMCLYLWIDCQSAEWTEHREHLKNKFSDPHIYHSYNNKMCISTGLRGAKVFSQTTKSSINFDVFNLGDLRFQL